MPTKENVSVLIFIKKKKKIPWASPGCYFAKGMFQAGLTETTISLGAKP